MGLFTPKVNASHSNQPVGLALLSIHSALSIAALQPLAQEPGSSSASSRVRRQALLIGVNGDFTIDSEDEWTDFDDEESPEEQNCPTNDSYQARSNHSSSWSSLKGPRKDVCKLKRLLIDTYNYTEDNITVLVDDGDTNHVQPTRDNIIMAIETLVADAQPEDEFVFAFSGHGFQKKAKPEDDEDDGLNEFIVASCGKGIKDNVLKKKLVLPLPPTCKLTAIFDSCHSATILGKPILNHSFKDLEHSKCNRTFFTPRINKGKRRTKTLQYQTKRRNGVLVDGQRLTLSGLPSSSSRGNSSGSHRYHSGPPLRQDTLKANLRRTRESFEHQHTNGMSKSVKSSISESAVSPSIRTPSQTSSRKPQRRKAHKLTIDTRGDTLGPSAHQDQAKANQFLPDSSCIVESPTGIVYESPMSRFQCDGLSCHKKQHEGEHIAMADVICLSSSQDSEKTWEDNKGHSMISHLVKLLRKNPNPTLHDLMTEIIHLIHESNFRIHERSREFRRMRARSYEITGREAERVYGPDNRRLSEFEMTHFQRPELSSRVPLDMKKVRWKL